MYQIGQFAKICNTTIKTLRYYDKENLLRPIKVNNYTNYRYYCEEQIDLMNKINKLKEAGLSLKDIKEILSTNNNLIIENRINIIKSVSKKQELILQEINKNMNKEKVKLITNPNNIIVGLEQKITNRKEIEKNIKEIDKLLYNELFEENIIVFENYEDNYTDKNIKCFIGRKLKETYKDNPGIISKIDNELTVTNNEMIKTMLYTKDKKENLKKAYKNIIDYALKEKIQIRGNYQEIYNNDEVELYVEAYDLKTENPDVIRIRNNMKKKLKNIQPKEYIGTWELMYEDNIPNIYKKRIKEEINYNIPSTKYTKFVINNDGTTNYDNIKLKENYLEVIEDNVTFYHKLCEPKEKDNNIYMKVLINFKESNSRPVLYIYKKKEK